MHGFTFADAIVGAVLFISAAMAFFRGFVHEVLAIAAWVGAAFATYYGFDTVEPWIAGQIGEVWAPTVCRASLFLLSLLALSLVTKAISNQVRKSALNSVDSSLGFVFGLARGMLLVSVLYYSAQHFIFDQGDMPGWLSNAKTKPWLERGEAEIEKFFPLAQDKAAEFQARATGDLEEDSKLGGADPALNAPDKATVENLASPKPTMPAAPPGQAPKAKGYDKEQRRGMDRLIQNTQ